MSRHGTARHIMNRHNPAHPGELLAGWLEDLGTTPGH